MRAPKKTIGMARNLRRRLSLPETLLWSRLRERAPGKPVFRRQHPVGRYVLDFYCAKARLAVEIEGISHDMGDRPLRDVRRNTWLAARGITVVRLLATDFIREIDGAVDAIIGLASERLEIEAPSTALRAVPLPRSHTLAGEDG